MSKRLGVARKGVSRSKGKRRKHVELVAQATPHSMRMETQTQEETVVPLATIHGTHRSITTMIQAELKNDGIANRASSASARLAARKAALLMTVEELRYVKHDLITIGGLTGFMLIILFDKSLLQVWNRFSALSDHVNRS